MLAMKAFRPRAVWVLPVLCFLLWVWAPKLDLRVDGDGYYHYLYLVTLFEDGDLDFVNQYQRYGHPYFNPQGPVWGNPFPPGSAVLWLPTYALTQTYTWFKGGPSDPFDSKFQARALSGTLIAGLLTLYFTFLLVRRRYDPIWAWPAVAGAVLATPFPYYLVWSPSYAHVPTAFFLTLFLILWLDHPRAAASVGLAAGLAAMAKHQAGILVPIAFLYLLTVEKDRRRAAKFGAGALLAVLPLLAYWRVAFGHWLTVPQGGGYMTTNFAGVAHSLWSVRHGALVWSPILVLSLAGLGALAARRDGRMRIVLLFFGMVIVVNGLPIDWWGGDSFGNRRWVDLFPILAIGLAHAFQGMAAWMERRPRAAAATGAGILVAVLALLNLGMITAYRRGRLDHSAYRDAGDVYGPGLREVYRVVGNPLSYPDNLLFALRHGVSPMTYDEIVGATLNVAPSSDGPVLDPTDPAVRKYFYRGFSFEPRPVIRGTEARIFLPEFRAKTLSLVLLLERNGGPVPLEVRLNGEPVGGADRYSWQEPVGLTIAEPRVKIGTNVLSLHFARGGEVDFGLIWQHPLNPYFIKLLPYGILDAARYDHARGTLEVVGWALGRSKAPDVALVQYPGRSETGPAARYPREDVARVHPEGAGLDRAGFTFRFTPGQPVGNRVCVVFRIAEPGGRTNWTVKSLPVEAVGGR